MHCVLSIACIDLEPRPVEALRHRCIGLCFNTSEVFLHCVENVKRIVRELLTFRIGPRLEVSSAKGFNAAAIYWPSTPQLPQYPGMLTP